MARPNTGIDRIAHATAASVMNASTQAITDFVRSPYRVYYCAFIAAFLCIGVGTVFLKWGISERSDTIVWAGLASLMLALAIWAGLGIAVLGMLWSLITDVIRYLRSENRE